MNAALRYIFLVGFLFAVGVQIGKAQVEVRLPDTTAEVGSTIAIPIQVGSLDGKDVTSYEFTLPFDSDVLQITGTGADSAITPSAPTVNATDTEIKVSFATSKALSGEGALLHLEAEIVGEGTVSMKFSDFQLYDRSANEVPSEPAAGTVTVGGEDDAQAPDSPTELEAATSGSSVSLSWAASDSSDVVRYRIYRDTVSIESLPSPYDSVGADQVTYSDEEVQGGTTYHYRITAVDGSGNESNPSSEISATPRGDEQVVYSEDFSGDPGYEVLYSDNADGSAEVYWDSTASDFYAKVRDQSSEWWSLGKSPVFPTVDSREAFTISFQFNPVEPDWGHYPGIYFIASDSSSGPREWETAFKFDIASSDNYDRQFRLTSESRYSTPTIPSRDESYDATISYDPANETVDLTILRADGSTFVEETGISMPMSGSFDQIMIGETQGSTKYGDRAQIRVDDIVVKANSTTDRYAPGDGHEYFVTDGEYDSETEDIPSLIDREYGSEAELAEWNDLKDEFEGDRDRLISFLDEIGMTERGDDAFVRRGGDRFHSGDRHYFLTRHDGEVPSHYAVHDEMHSNTVSLGSWYTTKPALVREPASVISRSANVSSSDTLNFGPTDVVIIFAEVSGAGEVTVQKYDSESRSPNGIEESNVSQYHFVIEAGGSLSFGAETEVRFDAGELGGIDDPNNVQVYRRGEVGSGSFSSLGTTVEDGGTFGDISDGALVVATGSFGEFAMGSDTEPLPVELAQLKATATGDAATLTWTTASETNNAGFAVQHRTDTTSQWQKRGFVDSKAEGGTTTEVQEYRFRADELRIGTHQFRLRQVDTDGTAHRSESITVEVTMEEAYRLTSYPNPARRQATVELAAQEKQEVRLTLYDILGRRVATLHDGPVPAQKTTRKVVDAEQLELSSGTYFLRLSGENGTRTSRLTIVR